MDFGHEGDRLILFLLDPRHCEIALLHRVEVGNVLLCSSCTSERLPENRQNEGSANE